MSDPKVGETLAYFAEPNAKGDPYSGPYPAKVTKVFPAKAAGGGKDAKDRKPAEPLRVDLLVKFSETSDKEHTKTGVLVKTDPEKHCCVHFDFDAWHTELEAEKAAEQRKLDAEQAKHAEEQAKLKAERAEKREREAFEFDEGEMRVGSAGPDAPLKA